MTMPILSVTQATTPPATQDKQSGGGTSDGTFNQVLSNEMSQQQDAKASAPNTNSPAPQTAPTDKTKKATSASQSPDPSQSVTPPQTGLPPISAELLAMMGNYQTVAHTTPAATSDTAVPRSNIAVTGNAAVTSTPAVITPPLSGIAPSNFAAASHLPVETGLPQGTTAVLASPTPTPTNNTSVDIPTLQTAPQAQGQPTDSIKPAILTSIAPQLTTTQKNDALLPLALPVAATSQLLPNPVMMSNLAQNTAPITGSGLSPQVGTSAWDHALGEKIVWMVGGAEQTASLSLNPPDLGPLQIVLNVTNNQANATFIAAQPEVRLAIEAAMPKLHEMLNNAGIQLGQTNVHANMSGHQNQQQNGQTDSRTFQTLNTTRATGIDATINISGKTITGHGLVNTFV
ncbi:MAG: flagellar hook-length control protein FliK [Betaproteobacteria bacterium]|nr:flagellar hook-length control protein FliK [Betaproteobacteria bacterium]